MKSSNDNGNEGGCDVINFPTSDKSEQVECDCTSCQTRELINDISKIMLKHGIIESFENGKLVVDNRPTAEAYYIMINALFMRAAALSTANGDDKVGDRLESLFNITETYAELTMREAAESYANNKKK